MSESKWGSVGGGPSVERYLYFIFYFIALEIRRKAAFASNVKAFCRRVFYWR